MDVRTFVVSKELQRLSKQQWEYDTMWLDSIRFFIVLNKTVKKKDDRCNAVSDQ